MTKQKRKNSTPSRVPLMMLLSAISGFTLFILALAAFFMVDMWFN